MADDRSLLEVDDRLGDAGGMVGDPFEVVRGVQEQEPGLQLLGMSAQAFLELFSEGAVLGDRSCCPL